MISPSALGRIDGGGVCRNIHPMKLAEVVFRYGMGGRDAL